MFATKLWAKGLMAAALGGVADAGLELGKPLLMGLASGTPSPLPDPSHLAGTMGLVALAAGLGYLKTHPPDLPGLSPAMDAAVVSLGANAVESRVRAKAKLR